MQSRKISPLIAVGFIGSLSAMLYYNHQLQRQHAVKQHPLLNVDNLKLPTHEEIENAFSLPKMLVTGVTQRIEAVKIIFKPNISRYLRWLLGISDYDSDLKRYYKEYKNLNVGIGFHKYYQCRNDLITVDDLKLHISCLKYPEFSPTIFPEFIQSNFEYLKSATECIIATDGRTTISIHYLLGGGFGSFNIEKRKLIMSELRAFGLETDNLLWDPEELNIYSSPSLFNLYVHQRLEVHRMLDDRLLRGPASIVKGYLM